MEDELNSQMTKLTLLKKTEKIVKDTKKRIDPTDIFKGKVKKGKGPYKKSICDKPIKSKLTKEFEQYSKNSETNMFY